MQLQLHAHGIAIGEVQTTIGQTDPGMARSDSQRASGYVWARWTETSDLPSWLCALLAGIGSRRAATSGCEGREGAGQTVKEHDRRSIHPGPADQALFTRCHSPQQPAVPCCKHPHRPRTEEVRGSNLPTALVTGLAGCSRRAKDVQHRSGQ
jgi:hypothetical protein